MTNVEFAKGHGTGNDFVVIPDLDGAIDPSAEQVAALCDRRFGIGGDGVLRVVRSRDVPGVDAEDAEWFMDYRNADGSVAEMCGNGIRVFAHYLLQSGLATLERGATLPIATRAGVRDIQATGSSYQVDLGRWRPLDGETLVRARGLDVQRPGLRIDLGNPHVVVALASDDELDGLDLTVEPVVEPATEDGVNVEFVVPRAVDDGVGQLRMRVFERGVGETLSCGTGAAAAALAVRDWAGSGAPNHWRVDVPGGTLGVRMFATEDGEHVGLSGPAVLTFSGTVGLG